jgi:hypothetical protein
VPPNTAKFPFHHIRFNLNGAGRSIKSLRRRCFKHVKPPLQKIFEWRKRPTPWRLLGEGDFWGGRVSLGLSLDNKKEN